MDKLIVIEKEELKRPENAMKYTTLSTKVISNIERIVRISYHYKIFIYYLKNVMNMNECAFYEGYSMRNGLGVEIHHSPLTLMDYVYAVANKHLKKDEYYKIMKVADEVTRLHYNFVVGLIPLNPTAHKMVHNQALWIHPELVKGMWQNFKEDYFDFLSNDCKNKLQEVEFKAEHEDPKHYPTILRRSQNIFVQKGVRSIETINVTKMLIDIKLKALEKMEE